MTEGRPIRATASVKRPFERVRAALLKDAIGVFRRATMVPEGARHAAGSLRFNVAGLAIGKDIDIQVTGSADTGGVGTVPSGTCLEMQWNALGNPALFPTMKAELVLSPISNDETQLELSGIYTPPLGQMGMVLDAMVGHHLAEASVHQFISDVAARLDHDLA